MCRLPFLCVELHPVPSWVLAFKPSAANKSDAPTPLLPHKFWLSDDRGVFRFNSVHFKWAKDQRMWHIFKISTVCVFCCAGNDLCWSVFTDRISEISLSTCIHQSAAASFVFNSSRIWGPEDYRQTILGFISVPTVSKCVAARRQDFKLLKKL